MNFSYKTKTVPDADILAAMRSLMSEIPSTTLVTSTMTIFGSGQPIALDTPMIDDLAQSFAFQFRIPEITCNVNFTRDGFVIKIDIAFSRQSGNFTYLEVMPAVQWLRSRFLPFSDLDYIKSSVSPQLAEQFQAREASLQKIETVSLNITKNYEAFRRKVEEENTARRIALEQEFESKKFDLDRAFDTRNQKLEEEKKELQDLQKQIDDRSNMHARRELHKQLLDTIRQRYVKFSISEETIKKRRILHVLFGGFILVLLFLLGFSILNFSSSLESYLKISLATLGFAATVIYYIRWNDSWFRKHADEEFNMKRFELDFERANWLVEMAMEWNNVKNEDIPNDLLQKLSENLFLQKPGEVVRHPTEDVVAQLFASIAGMNIALPGGSSVTFDKKTIKALAKQLGENSD